MEFFDFHHHHRGKKTGIYTLKPFEEAPEFLFSAGLHPNEIREDLELKLQWLKEILKHKNCAAVGECGLDAFSSADTKLQEEVFQKHINLANYVHKPVIIHCVKRFAELPRFKKIAKVPMIVHGFNKKRVVGENLLKNDFYLSFGKSALFNVNLQDFLKDVPSDRLFLETDDSDFDLEDLYRKTAELKNCTLEEVETMITENLQVLKILN